jgi:hypothetical protein
MRISYVNLDPTQPPGFSSSLGSVVPETGFTLRSARHVTRPHRTFSFVGSVDSGHRQRDSRMYPKCNCIGARGGHREQEHGRGEIASRLQNKSFCTHAKHDTTLVSPTIKSFQACLVLLLPPIPQVQSGKDACHSRCPLWQTGRIRKQSLFHRFLTHRPFLPQVDHHLAETRVYKKC